MQQQHLKLLDFAAAKTIVINKISQNYWEIKPKATEMKELKHQSNLAVNPQASFGLPETGYEFGKKRNFFSGADGQRRLAHFLVAMQKEETTAGLVQLIERHRTRADQGGNFRHTLLYILPECAKSTSIKPEANAENSAAVAIIERANIAIESEIMAAELKSMMVC